MIPFDFEYFRPSTLEEAVQIYFSRKNPRYYGGGTEIISMARVQSIEFDAVIDLKGIPECNVLELSEHAYIIGACCTLTQIAQHNAYPLLSKTVKRIADHTIQGKITLGGNLGGTVIYREAALPLILADCTAKIMGRDGAREAAFTDIFNEGLRLAEGEFLVSISIQKEHLGYPFAHVKRTKSDKIDYPLITLAAIKKDGKIKTATTSDLFANPKYKEFVLKNMLEDVNEILG